MNRIEHRESKWIFKFVEYSNIKSDEKLPLIIQLHGAGERGNGEDELIRVDKYGFSDYIKDRDYPCLFILPQCPADTFWAARVESIVKFIDQLKEEYNIDEDRVYLTGMSMGGYGTWFTAMARPDLFAAIVPVCGGGMAWNAETLTMPIWTFHGSDDPLVSVNQTDEMVNALREIGADIKYTRIEGGEHDAWNYTFDDELISWLLSKKR